MPERRRAIAAADRGSDAPGIHRAAHELRTPLTSILGLFALLADGTVMLDSEEAAELAALGRSEAEQMLFLIENLLVSGRLAEDSLDPARDDVELPSIIHEALAKFPEVARRTFVPIDKTAVAVGDRRLIAQIVTNLVQNVERYAPDGEVEFRFEHGDGKIAVHIADDGPGVEDDRVDEIFSGTRSERGMGLGLGLSREIAAAMGGDLVLDEPPLRAGATFTLTLPAGDPGAGITGPAPAMPAGVSSTLPHRARTLVDMTEVLADRSLDRLVAGLHRMFADLLGAHAGCLAVQDRSGALRLVGGFGWTGAVEAPFTDVTAAVMSGSRSFVADLATAEPEWAALLGSISGLFIPVPGSESDDAIGVLAVGWDHAREPSPAAIDIATALARLAAFGADRAALAADADFEQRLRASVMEALPIAISVFVGDPPQVVDWNESERRLLGIASDDERPSNLAHSQEKFDVRFLDGTRLDAHNSPVTNAMRTGATTGPFYLRVTRPDGTSATTRTYCAPFFDGAGRVTGAVVTSEEIDDQDIPYVGDGALPAP